MKNLGAWGRRSELAEGTRGLAKRQIQMADDAGLMVANSYSVRSNSANPRIW